MIVMALPTRSRAAGRTDQDQVEPARIDDASPREGPRGPKQTLRLAISVLVIGLLTYLVLVPTIVLMVSSLKPSGFLFDPGFTLSNLREVFGSSRTYHVMLNTLVLAVGCTTVALTLGITFAWLIERTNLPGARAFRVLIILPMATPPLLLGISWILLLEPRIGIVNTTLEGLFGPGAPVLGIYNMQSMIILQGLSFVSTAFLLVAPSFRSMDPSLEEAGLASGATMARIVRKIMLPIVRPALLAAGIFIFIVSLLVFDIPGVLGIRAGIFVLSSEIFYRVAGAAGLPNYGVVGAFGAIPLMVLLPLAYMYQRLLRRADRFVTVTGKGYRPRRVDLGKFKYPAVGLLFLYFAAAILIPLAALSAISFFPYYAGIANFVPGDLTLANHSRLFADPTIVRAIRNTLVVGFSVATGVVLFSSLTSWLVVRRGGRAGMAIDRLSFLPVALSNTMIGLALIYVYLSLSFMPIYGSIWIIAIAHFTAYLTFASRTMNSAMLQLHPELEESSWASGASFWRTFRKVTIPLVSPALLMAWIWVLAHSMRELSAAVLLQGRGNEMVSTVLWDYWQRGSSPIATALGVWLLLSLTVLALVWDRMSAKTSLSS
jgi:iron(III) transport system permease protein